MLVLRLKLGFRQEESLLWFSRVYMRNTRDVTSWVISLVIVVHVFVLILNAILSFNLSYLRCYMINTSPSPPILPQFLYELICVEIRAIISFTARMVAVFALRVEGQLCAHYRVSVLASVCHLVETLDALKLYLFQQFLSIFFFPSVGKQSPIVLDIFVHFEVRGATATILSQRVDEGE